ncbi:hypothetical protein EH243_10795 [Amphritea opalescens]|uniref:Uncharacterized protein n=1 Tax=Amphritea opalescens TaxID=2490544 RepID=A0A430KQJ9_9GAMM|nr:hypothetical protein [Amphritea opalescens]RTE65750.1 hypothetical protein EH243_10795 [Amphritea opalescens]
MFLKGICLIATVFSLVGCATPGTLPFESDITKSRTYAASYDQVWKAIIAGVAESNLNITTIEKDSGIIAISNSSYEPNWAYEGTRGNVMNVPDQVVERSANFNILAVSEEEKQTRVQVNSSFKMKIKTGNGSNVYPFNYQWQRAYSNGTLEKIILDGIARRVE